MFAPPEEQKMCRVRVHDGMLVTEGHGMTAVLASCSEDPGQRFRTSIRSCDARCILTEDAGTKTLEHIRDLWNAHVDAQQQAGPDHEVHRESIREAFRRGQAQGCTPPPPEEPTPLPSLDDPCPHEARSGRHEVYACMGGKICRACGASDHPVVRPEPEREPWALVRFIREAIRGHEAEHIATDHTGKTGLGEHIDAALAAKEKR